MKKILTLLLLFATLITACSRLPQVTRLDTNSVTDLSGKWNDTDSRLVSKNMIAEMFGNPWYKNWSGKNDKPPVVIVGRMKNETMEHINTGAFVSDLEYELINSGKIAMVAEGTDREDVRRERLDQLSNATEETLKEFGREIGADYMLFGKILSFTDEAGGTKVVTYQIDMYLVDIEKNLKSWAGQKRIKKQISRGKVKL